MLIDGKALAAKMREEIKSGVAKFKNSRGRSVGLAVILVGENPASQVYVRNKIKACEETGIKSFAYYRPQPFPRPSRQGSTNHQMPGRTRFAGW